LLFFVEVTTPHANHDDVRSDSVPQAVKRQTRKHVSGTSTDATAPTQPPEHLPRVRPL